MTDLRGPGDCYAGRRPDTNDNVAPDVLCQCGWLGFRAQLVAGEVRAECPECGNDDGFEFDFERE